MLTSWTPLYLLSTRYVPLPRSSQVLIPLHYVQIGEVVCILKMADGPGEMNEVLYGFDDKSLSSRSSQRSNALANRLTSVLSASFVDSDIRDALRTLDENKTQNTLETRRALRLDVQKELIKCDGGIVKDFGLIAEVRLTCIKS